jgi:hypothetical protein
MHHHTTMTLWALVGLGAWHGLNPGMGWLFAVALGMQEDDRRAVWRTLAPLAAGHAVAVAVVLALALAAGRVIPLGALRWASAVLLVGFGLWRLVSTRHPRWGGMRVGFRDLTIWSFLMASAHGAGLMLLPLVLPDRGSGGAIDPMTATLVHTAAYLTVTGAVAAIVYEKLGLGLLRRAWLNVDLLWAGGLVLAGVVILL